MSEPGAGSPSLGFIPETYGTGVKVDYFYITACLDQRGLLFLKKTLYYKSQKIQYDSFRTSGIYLREGMLCHP